MFFADKRVVPLLPRLLGKKFFKRKKVPVPLDLKKGNWKEQVERACSSALFSVGTGTCSVVRVAKVAMAREEIVANVVAAIEGVVEAVPRKWGNVRSFHVKLLESLALPVYQKVPDVRLRIEGGKGEGEGRVVEEEGKKKAKRKGRIHEVRYMDSEVGEDHVEDELGSDDDDEEEEDEDLEDDEKGSGELVSKKRKKGVRMENGALSELSSVKRAKESDKDNGEEGAKQKKGRVSAELMNKNLIERSRNGNLSVEDGESGKKMMKKKSGLVQLGEADVARKVKAKRFKTAA